MKVILLSLLMGISAATQAMCYEVFDASNELIFSSTASPIRLDGPSPSASVQERFPGGHMVIRHSDCEFFDRTTQEGRERTAYLAKMKSAQVMVSASKAASGSGSTSSGTPSSDTPSSGKPSSSPDLDKLCKFTYYTKNDPRGEELAKAAKAECLENNGSRGDAYAAWQDHFSVTSANRNAAAARAQAARAGNTRCNPDGFGGLRCSPGF